MAGWHCPQLSTAARLVSFNLLPAHGWLAPAIVSHLSQHGKHVTDLIKNMLSKLRGLYPQGMWEVYLNALKMGFERHRAAGQDGLDGFKELSAKIALSFGGNLLGCVCPYQTVVSGAAARVGRPGWACGHARQPCTPQEGAGRDHAMGSSSLRSLCAYSPSPESQTNKPVF